MELRRVRECLSESPHVSASKPSTWAVRDLQFSYTTEGPELFDCLTHDFAPGKITALAGPSGRGKSTLLYILGLLLRPSAGIILCDGEDITHIGDTQASAMRASRIGFIFQSAELNPRVPIIESIMEPGLYQGRPRAELRRNALKLLQLFDLTELAGHKPGQISGGQAQRVAVCRALITNPDLILADEPTGNLDPANSAIVLNAINAAAEEGRTVLIATHDPLILTASDEVLEL
ncbi:ATP-binding cassette domain-containing protein [Trueperella pyogenes]|uniref:ABC transporter ATP-binding protein n=1 Tax=Trueperella pyogenes TaxID=1661 RepID=UPI0024C075F6|nr:ATP-binding cassette domain-containing protein [Trueperella pyogenes]WHU57461.1 ATP-binding cassette domain-containing protein [Trueperella pyogenes]